MVKSVDVVLGGTTYTLHPCTIGDLERISDIFSEQAARPNSIPFHLLRLALKRATPACDDPDAIEVQSDEVAIAVAAYLEIAGLKPPAGASPPTPPAQGATAAD